MDITTVKVETAAATGQVVEVEHMDVAASPLLLGVDLSAADMGCLPGTEYRVRVFCSCDAVLLDEVVAAR
jgi:hypothetical protein